MAVHVNLIASHAVVGGIGAVINGGKFGNGFVSAGVVKGLGGAFLPGGNELVDTPDMIKNTVISAVIGGTASVLTGGKFGNGAQTGAMQYMLNQAAGKVLSQQASRGRKALDALIKKHGLRKTDIIAANAYLKTDMSLNEFTELFPQFAGKNELLVDAQLTLFSSEFGKTVALYEGVDFGKAFGESAVKSWWGALEWLSFGIAEFPTHNVTHQQIIQTYGDAYYAPPDN